MLYKFFFLLLLLTPEFLSARLPCCRLQLPGWWAEADYLLVWRKGRSYPPLVTTSPSTTSLAQSGVLGEPGTSILFGNTTIKQSPVSGIRVDLGLWLTRCLGFGVSYLSGGNEKEKFRRTSNEEGLPILARPFFDVNLGVQDSQVITHPLIPLLGDVRVDVGNQLWGSDVYARLRLCRGMCMNFEVLGGFIYTQIKDDLNISSRTSGLLGVANFQSDHFKAENDFYAALIGLLFEFRSRCYSLQVIGKAGIGKMSERVEIEGMTRQGGLIFNEGLLARPSNSGEHFGDDFQVVPEVLANLKFRIYPQLWWTLGYMAIFWPNVALAGDQVNLNVGLNEPIFQMRKSCFWMQAFVTGLYVCF